MPKVQANQSNLRTCQVIGEKKSTKVMAARNDLEQ
jgi:hypothetical protein